MRVSGPALALLCALGIAGCETVSEKIDPLEPDAVSAAGARLDLLNAPDHGAAALRAFEAAVAREPDSIARRRDLARAYLRAGRLRRASETYAALEAAGADEPSDRLEAALISVRLDEWAAARATAARGPLPEGNARAALLRALLADRAGDWTGADAAYAEAVALAPDPAAMLNNWGVSRMARGALGEAAASFTEAVRADPEMFAAKNNLVLANALRGDYALPAIPMTERERAVLLNNAGVIAQRRGERETARRLFSKAVDTHPAFFGDAMRNLSGLKGR